MLDKDKIQGSNIRCKCNEILKIIYVIGRNLIQINLNILCYIIR